MYDLKMVHNIWLVPLIFIFCLMPSIAFAACSSPLAQAGGIIYNSSHQVIQFCNGTDWINAIGSSGGLGSETDPKVGNIATATKWCRTDGSMIICDQDAPSNDLPTGCSVGDSIAWNGTAWVCDPP